MTTEPKPDASTSTSAWNSLAPSSGVPLPAEPAVQPDAGWKWGWSAFIGIHYGPIPVGLIIAIPILIAMAR